MEFKVEVKEIEAQNVCDQGNYYPCSCASQGPQYYDSLYCDASSVTVEAVADMFHRITTPVLDTFVMTYFPNALSNWIPTNFTANKIIMQNIRIECLDHTFVKISNNAFDSTSSLISHGIVTFVNCNLENFYFLTNFSKITYLVIDSFPDLGNIFSTFSTYFPVLVMLTIRNCIGWDHLHFMPSVLEAKQLKTCYLTVSVNMNDDSMGLVMDWAVQSFGSFFRLLYNKMILNLFIITGNFNKAVIELRSNMITRLE